MFTALAVILCTDAVRAASPDRRVIACQVKLGEISGTAAFKVDLDRRVMSTSSGDKPINVSADSITWRHLGPSRDGRSEVREEGAINRATGALVVSRLLSSGGKPIDRTLTQGTCSGAGAFIDPMAMGVAQIREREYEDAIISFTSALKDQSKNADAYLLRGYALFYLGKLDEAETDYKHAIRLAPTVSQGYFNYGLVLDERGRPKDAVEQYLKALQYSPGDASAHYNLGNSYSKLGRYADAAKSFEEAARIEPLHPYAAKNLAIVRSKLGR